MNNFMNYESDKSTGFIIFQFFTVIPTQGI